MSRRARRTSRGIPALLAAAVVACGGGSSGSGVGTGGPAGSVRGTVTYDRVPATASAGLDFAATAPRPVRGAVVRLVHADTLATVAEGQTDASGAYALPIPSGAPPLARVLVLARTTTPPLEVRDNTDGSLWSLVSEPFPPGETTRDLHATSGWTGTRYDARTRIAAPFAILDSLATAAQAFLAVRPAASFPPLTVNWSPDNVPEPGSNAAGQIGTSHWDGQQLYLLGAEDVDTDEFDDHVVVHEWGHYFESELARSDTPGGSHAAGDLKDPRLAWSEGWGNGIGAIVLAPDTSYRDTDGPGQAETAIDDDLESDATGPGSNDPAPGWWSEESIARILVDVADGPGGDAEPADRVALGLGAIYDVLAGPLPSASALATVFTFLSALGEANPAARADLDALAAAKGFTVADAYGGGETRPGTGAPLYLRTAAFPRTLTLAGSASNDVNANWYVRVQGTGVPVTVSASSSGDVALAVFLAGVRVAGANAVGAGGTEAAQFATVAGLEYVVVLTGFPSRRDDSFTARVTFTSP